MGELSALLYPATYPKRHVRHYLSLLFDDLHLLLPSEGSKDQVIQAAEEDEIHVEAHVPLPLGEKLDWFQSLVRDWQQWAQQLGLGQDITDASVAEAASYIMEESLQSIINSIKGPDRDDKDLEAQIFLELALELDMREDELSRDMNEIFSREETLKDLLAGPADFGRRKGARSALRIEPLTQGFRRLAAWARLYAKLGKDMNFSPVGEGINTKDFIDGAYEALKKEPAQDILALDLSLYTRNSLPDSHALRPLIQELLQNISAAENPGKNPRIEELTEEVLRVWRQPEQPLGPNLVLTAYPGVPWRDLLSKAARLESVPSSSNGACGYSFHLV